jgi:hypothetical protein
MKNFVRRLFAKDTQKADAEDDDGIYVYKSQPTISTIIITTLGVEARHLEDIIVTTKKKLPRENDRLVYITDNSDFTAFRRHGVIFEYLPPLKEQQLHAADMPWRAYLRERWGLLVAKWRPRQVLAYGTDIDSFLAAAPAASIRRVAEMPRS